MADQNLNCNCKKYEISSWCHLLLWIRVHHSEIQNNGFNIAEQNNKNEQIWMKFGTRKFLRSLLLKLEMQKYRKVPIC